MSGTQDVVVAGGVQNMSMIPIAAALTAAEPFGFSDPFSGSKGWQARYGDQEVSQFRGAEMIVEKWDISRDDMERYALESHRRAAAGDRRGSLRARDRRLRRGRGRRGAVPRYVARADGDAAGADRGRPPDGGGVEPDLRRGGGDARGLGARPYRPRPEAACPDPPPQRARAPIRSTCSRRRSRRPPTRSNAPA